MGEGSHRKYVSLMLASFPGPSRDEASLMHAVRTANQKRKVLIAQELVIHAA